jgi:hypothetical protein
LFRSLLLHGKRNKWTLDLAIAGVSFCSGLACPQAAAWLRPK